MGNSNLRLFWILNIAYWAVFYVINYLTSPIFLAFNEIWRLVLVLTFLGWIMLFTGIYRFVYQQFRVWEKPLKFVIQQTILAILAISFMDIYVRYSANQVILSFILNFYKADVLNQDFIKNVYPPNYVELQSYLSLHGQCVKIIAYCFWCVAFNFYRYSFTVNDAKVAKLKAENQLKEAELINLRSQLNPHFLFNSLNSIHSLALSQNEKASESVLLLSDLMRYTLNYEKKDLVALDEEIDIVKKYLELEKIRFGKRLNFAFDIAEDTLGKKLPPIIIQTLTENAIKHAISQNTEGGYIKIKSRLNASNLLIEICNSGQIRENNISKHSGIGLENTCKRLKMIYGNRARFELKNSSPNEVTATIEIPV